MIRLRPSALLFCKSCCDCVSSLSLKIERVLFVKVFQFVRCWVRSRDIEMAVLQKIIICVSAANPASADKLLVTLSYQRDAHIF